MRHVPTNSVTQIVPAAETNYAGLAFSPDGNYLYCVRREKDHPDLGLLYQIPVLGGTPRLLVTDVDSGISFSPDGRRFAYLRNSTQLKTSAILIADADGTHEQQVTEETFPTNFGGSPSWSPDGKVIAAMDYFGQKSGELGQFMGVDVATGRKTKIASFTETGQVTGSAWLPDGSGLLVAVIGLNTNWTTQIGFVSYPAGQFRRITNDLNRYSGAISTTRDGRSLVTVANEKTSNIWVMPASGTSAQAAQISSGKTDATNLDWTADGRILSSTANTQGFEFNLRKSDGAGKTTVLSNAQPVLQPTACGDGHSIVFTGLLSQGEINLWRVDSSGGNLKEITTGKVNQGPICSPDGQWVAYQTLDDAGNGIFRVPIDGGSPVRLSPRPGYSPAISPDGKLVAFVSVEGTAPRFQNRWLVVPSSGGAPVYTFDADIRAINRVRFTPDGKSLAYVVNEHGVSNLWAVPLGGGQPKQLTDFKSDQIFDFAWSRDGKLLALSRGQVSNDVVLLTDTSH